MYNQATGESHSAVKVEQAGKDMLKVYLVEDSAVIAEGLTATLEDLVGAEVVGVSGTVAEAVTGLGRRDADWSLAIVDIFLDQGSGLDVLKAFEKRDSARKKMVVLSNYATPEVRKRCLDLGADAVFDKATEIEKLVDFCDELAR